MCQVAIAKPLLAAGLLTTQIKMEEIKIQIECLESEMQTLTNKVYRYSKHGRHPNESDWLEIISLLNEWSNKRQQLIALQECLSAIVNNARS